MCADLEDFRTFSQESVFQKRRSVVGAGARNASNALCGTKRLWKTMWKASSMSWSICGK